MLMRQVVVQEFVTVDGLAGDLRGRCRCST
jgi:hypothetical protein